jgi:hypothetical protein
MTRSQLARTSNRATAFIALASVPFVGWMVLRSVWSAFA